ncbi:hypothetical protein CT151_14825 [Raoultella planticola]|nr:hypothetical protein CT151_14825 [Raoultella planticola]RNN94627.1 hypothetical protein BL127_00016880 [Raoultella planticola]
MFRKTATSGDRDGTTARRANGASLALTPDRMEERGRRANVDNTGAGRVRQIIKRVQDRDRKAASDFPALHHG